MTYRAMLCRRSLIATAIGGGVTWLVGRVSFLVACRGRSRSMSFSSAIAAFCFDLSCPRIIGDACLEALPAIETSRGCLARAILADMRLTGKDGSSATALALSIRQRIREDFRDGRIVTVDGWMLSLTEMRVYALATLLL